MSSIKERSSQLIKALEDKDFTTFNRCKVSITAELADNDYMTISKENIFNMSSPSDNLLVGKALSILLYDMSKTGLIYRRVVVAALHCLLKTIIHDKACNNKETVLASLFLLILFQENEDFIGGEYIARMVRHNTEAAAYQFIGMTCVFYWMYKLSSFKIEVDLITKERFQQALNHTILDMRDEDYRSKVIDFEFNNFDAMIKSLPLDFELKYPGVPFWDPETVYQKIESMFGNSLANFQGSSKASVDSRFESSKKNQPSTKTTQSTQSATTSNNSGCLSVVMILVIIVSIFCIF